MKKKKRKIKYSKTFIFKLNQAYKKLKKLSH